MLASINKNSVFRQTRCFLAILSVLDPVSTVYLCKFGKNPSTTAYHEENISTA